MRRTVPSMRLRRSLTLLVAPVALVAPAVLPGANTAAAAGTPEVPSLPAGATAPFVVVTRAGADPAKVADAADAETDHVYRSAVRGFAAELDRDGLAELRRDPRVVEVLPDIPVHAVGTQVPTPSWGLDRVDQRGLPLSGGYSWKGTNTPVTAYVVDTGVAKDHTQFAGRMSASYFDALGGDGTDCNGHGTHVAGTVAGATFGVARTAQVVPVRVLDCSGSGSISSVIAGVDWAVSNHTSGPAVLNMSLGGGAYQPLDDAVARATADGITVVVAAGNSNADACGTSPSRAASALTVGATGSNDARASFSNWGTCVDLFAPGVGITSSYTGSTTATASLSGTSMASPHVAGAAAVYLSQYPAATPAQVTAALSSGATTGLVTGAGTGSPDRLLYMDPAGSPAPGGTTPTTTVPPTTTAPTTTTPTTVPPTTPTPTTVPPTTTTTTTTTVPRTTTTTTPPTTVPRLPGAPGRPRLRGGAASVVATWPAAAANGSPVRSYTVNLYRSAAPAAVVGSKTSTSTAVAFTGLTNGTSYMVRVSATSAAGTGPMSEASPPAVAADVPSTPAAPAAKALVGGLEVRWAEPNGNGSKVQYYMVSALPPGARTWTVLGYTGRTTVSLPVAPGSWSFKVQAVNTMGPSPWSPPSAAVAPLKVVRAGR